MTFGQCEAGGCGGDHAGSWNPFPPSAVMNAKGRREAREEKEDEETKEKNKTVVGTDEWQSEQDKQKKLADTKKQFKKLGVYAGLGLGGYIAFEVALKLSVAAIDSRGIARSVTEHCQVCDRA